MNKVISDGKKVVISEMSSEAVSGLISLDPELVSKVIKNDPEPMFITLDILTEGVSRNGRYYSEEALNEVSRQINTEFPDGYAGHITQEERKSKVPDAEVIWLGSKVLELDGKKRLFAKGYVLPEAKKRRSYLSKAQELGKSVAVSIYGTAKQVWDNAIKAYRQLDIDLESIDFTRPKSEGVPNSGLYAVSAEMSGNEEKGIEMEKTELLQTVTAEELRQNVPAEVLQEITEEAVAKADEESRSTFQEMESEKDSIIAEMRTENRELKLNEQLNQKVVDKNARQMIKQLVISEMADDEAVENAVSRVLESEVGKAVVSEMTTTEPTITPRIDQAHAVAKRSYKYLNKR